MSAGLITSLPLAIAVILPFANRAADVPFSLADTAGTLVTVPEVWDFDIGDGDADVFSPLPADHLAVRNVLPQILADLPADNLLEALLVVIDGSGHNSISQTSPKEARFHCRAIRVPALGISPRWG